MRCVYVWSINYDRTTKRFVQLNKEPWKKMGKRNKYPEMGLRIAENRGDSIRYGRNKNRRTRRLNSGRLGRTPSIDVRLIEAGTKKKFISLSKEKVSEDRKAVFISAGNFKPFFRITVHARYSTYLRNASCIAIISVCYVIKSATDVKCFHHTSTTEYAIIFAVSNIVSWSLDMSLINRRSRRINNNLRRADLMWINAF